MKEKIFNVIKLGISLMLFFTIGFICSYILKVFNVDVNNLSDINNVIYQLVISLILFIILFAMYYNTIKEDYSKFKKHICKNIKYIIKLFIIFMIVKYIVSFITVLIITLLKYDMNSVTSVNQNIIVGYVKAAPLIMIFTTSILAPIYEETLFRLGFKKVLNNGLLFIVISGFIFGILHVFPLSDGVDLTLGIVQSISYVTMGIFLAYIYNKTDNIFISIGVHFLNNFLSILTMINMM